MDFCSSISVWEKINLDVQTRKLRLEVPMLISTPASEFFPSFPCSPAIMIFRYRQRQEKTRKNWLVFLVPYIFLEKLTFKASLVTCGSCPERGGSMSCAEALQWLWGNAGSMASISSVILEKSFWAWYSLTLKHFNIMGEMKRECKCNIYPLHGPFMLSE